jgi:hypothetical protein
MNVNAYLIFMHIQTKNVYFSCGVLPCIRIGAFVSKLGSSEPNAALARVGLCFDDMPWISISDTVLSISTYLVNEL